MLDRLSGELRVFTNEYKEKVFFNTQIGSNKNKDGEYINLYVAVEFSKEVKKEVAKVYKQKYFDMLLKDGWLSCYKNKDGNVVPTLFVNKATIVVSEDKPKKTTKAKKEAEEDDSLPF